MAFKDANRLLTKWEKIARIFSRNYGIKVQLSGLACNTDGTGTINIPANADDLNEGDQQVLEGLVDHEWSHVHEERETKDACGRLGRTPNELMKACANASERGMLNVFEDIRIEIKQGAKYPGVAENLDRAMRHSIAKNAEKMRVHGARADFWWLLGVELIGQGRGYEFDWIPAEIKKLVATTLTDEVAASRKTVIAEETFKLAKSTVAKVEKAREEAEKKAEELRKKLEEARAKKAAEEAEKRAAEEPAEEERAADESDEADDESKDESETEDEDGDSDEGGDSDDSGDDDESEANDAGDSDEVRSTGKERSDDTAEAGSSDDADEGDDEGEADAIGEGDDVEPAEVGDGEAGIKSGSDDIEALEEELKAAEEEADALAESERDATITDMMKAAKDDLSAKAKEDAATNPRWIVPPEVLKQDRAEAPADFGWHADEYAKARAEIASQISTLKARILTVLRASTDARFEGGKERGTIDVASLYALRTGSKDVFAQEVPGMQLDTAVILLVDESGSMGAGRGAGSGAHYARASAIALSETLAAVNIPFEVIGYQNVPGRRPKMEEGTARFFPNLFNIYKSFGESFKSVKNRLAAITGGQENVDGEAVMFAARRLSDRREARKIMMVLSDGQPAGGAVDSLSRWYLNETIKRASKAGIEVHGIGMNTTSVEKYYNEKNGAQNVVVTDLDTLATMVLKILKAKLMRRVA